MVNEKYDLVILGSGPGGYVAAIRAAQLGMSVAIIEKEHLGGICLNWGCIPTKTMLKSAEVLSTLKRSEDYGVSAENIGFDLEKIVTRSKRIADQLSSGVKHLLSKNKIKTRPLWLVPNIEIIEYNGSDWATVLTYDWNDGANDISEPADLDGDGSLEVAAIDEDGVVGVFSFDGSSVTSETVNNSNPSGTSFDGGGNQIAVFNLDNIGLPEIIVSQQDASESSDLRIYTSTSANNYDRSSSNDLHGGVEIQALAVADFDGDGNGEIYYATDGGSAGNDLYHLEYSGSGGSFTSFDFTTASLQR